VNVVWVTSFNRRLYDLSGHAFVESFNNHTSVGTLFIGAEDGLHVHDYGKRAVTYNLGEDAYVAGWLAENNHVIPVEYGGSAVPCDCKCPRSGGNKEHPRADHKRGCYWSWFNRNAFRWFKKIPTIAAAQKETNPDVMVWIDCDCFLTRDIKPEMVGDLSKLYDILYMKGPFRDIPEGGLVVYNLRRRGGDFFHRVMEHYSGQQFQLHYRWDDSYVLWCVIKNENFECLDIVTQGGRDSHVMKHSLLKEYIAHNKGYHARAEGFR